MIIRKIGGSGASGIGFSPAATTKSFLPLQFTALDLAVAGDLYGKQKTTNQGSPSFKFLADNPFGGTEGCVEFLGLSSGSILGNGTIAGDSDFTIEINGYGDNTTPFGFGAGGLSVFSNGHDLILRINGSNEVTLLSAFTDNTWYQAVIMRASDTIYLGVNGTWAGSTYNATGSGFGTASPFVGQRYIGDFTNNEGRFANFRASNSAIYSTSSWTPPTEMFTS